MFDVLEHMADEIGTLRQAHSLLRPAGRLFITVPAYEFLFSADDDAAGHFRRYTRKTLGAALSLSGYRVVYSTYMFAPLPPLVFLTRTAPSRLGLRQGLDEARLSAEHSPGWLASVIMDGVLGIEAQHIEAGQRIPFGNTCFTVAERD
jgi:hypothetical protein